MNNSRHATLTYSAQPMRPPPTIAAAMVVVMLSRCLHVDKASAVRLENELALALLLP